MHILRLLLEVRTSQFLLCFLYNAWRGYWSHGFFLIFERWLLVWPNLCWDEAPDTVKAARSTTILPRPMSLLARRCLLRTPAHP